MNEYKLAWMVEANMLRPSSAWQQPIHNEGETFGSKVKHHLKEEAKDTIILAAATYALTHAAQSQISGPIGQGLRVGGRIALRAIPMVGMVWAAYSVYDWLH